MGDPGQEAVTVQSYDPRWRQWAQRVHDETPVRSVVSYRIQLTRSHRAALTLYSHWPHAFDEDEVALGSIFASYCSLVLLTELVLDEPLHERRAADVHREIGVALALLIGTARSDADEHAHARLGRAATRLRDHLAG